MQPKWAQRRLWRTKRVACGLRLVSGTHDGLAGRWRHGVAQVSPNKLRWQKGFLGTIFIRPGTPWVEIDVLAVDVEGLRPGSYLDALKGLNPDTVSFVLQSADAAIECACFPRAVEAALVELGFPPPRDKSGSAVPTQDG